MPQFTWVGKKAVENHHNEVPYRLLKCDGKLSAGDPNSGNLMVEGDNLHALKAMLPYYAGQVKCIYIDPPYNTGNQSWVYNDAVDSPEIRHWLGKAVGAEAEDLSRHDKWLCMMLPRVKLLREFLRQDGIIFASIDDVEVDNLRQILDEIFGRVNRVGTIVWQNATDNNPTTIAPEHEYILCYAKDKTAIPSEWKATNLDAKTRLMEVGEQFIREFSNQEARQAAYTKWFRENRPFLWPFEDYKFIDDGGVYTGMRAVHNPGKEGYRYDVPHKVTKKACQQPMMGYRFPWETMQELLRQDRILFGDDETKIIELKVYAKDYRAKLSSVFELDGRKGTNEIKEIFPESKRAFNFPKPSALIEELLSFVTQGDDLILDSFAGSGTTGHAVLKLNHADGGQRRFILVELDQTIAQTITAERLRRVMHGHGELQGFGGGFRYCTLGEPLTDERGHIRQEVKFSDLAHHVYFAETGQPLPKRVTAKSPLIGTHNGTAYYLLFNGILGDKRTNGGNVLTGDVLGNLPPHEGRRVVFGEGIRLSPARLARERIVFRQVPYEIKAG